MTLYSVYWGIIGLFFHPMTSHRTMTGLDGSLNKKWNKTMDDHSHYNNIESRKTLKFQTNSVRVMSE